MRHDHGFRQHEIHSIIKYDEVGFSTRDST